MMAGGGLLCTPVGSRMPPAGTADAIVRVDETWWIGSGLFQNCSSFFGTKGAIFCCGCFVCTDGILNPNHPAKQVLMMALPFKSPSAAHVLPAAKLCHLVEFLHQG